MSGTFPYIHYERDKAGYTIPKIASINSLMTEGRAFRAGEKLKKTVKNPERIRIQMSPRPSLGHYNFKRKMAYVLWNWIEQSRHTSLRHVFYHEYAHYLHFGKMPRSMRLEISEGLTEFPLTRQVSGIMANPDEDLDNYRLPYEHIVSCEVFAEFVGIYYGGHRPYRKRVYDLVYEKLYKMGVLEYVEGEISQ